MAKKVENKEKNIEFPKVEDSSNINLGSIGDSLNEMYGVTSKSKDLNQAYLNVTKAYQKLVSPLSQLIEEGYYPQRYLSESLRSTNFENQVKLEEEINNIKSKLSSTLKELKDEKDKAKTTEELKILIDKLYSKEKINHIISRIHEEAKKRLFSDDDFKSMFDNGREYFSVVVSIDIRRSTELMLKARTPELFSKFITELSNKLSQIIINNYGIFDKFTGDGILAFFPKFYSGKNAILRALKAADECHLVFKEHYDKSRECFNVFIKDIGLGIGVDYGNVTLVNSSNELTVVGIPVVYACRMSGANAGETLLNQPAKEELLKHCQTNLKIYETDIQIKNEGTALAYSAEFVSKIALSDDFEWKENKNKPSTEKNDESNSSASNVES